MGLYERYLLPKFIGCACGAKPIMRQRRKIVPLAEGETLEIGIGAGHNLKYYEVHVGHRMRVVGLEPLAPLRDMAGVDGRAPRRLEARPRRRIGRGHAVRNGTVRQHRVYVHASSVASVERVLAEARARAEARRRLSLLRTWAGAGLQTLRSGSGGSIHCGSASPAIVICRDRWRRGSPPTVFPSTRSRRICPACLALCGLERMGRRAGRVSCAT